MSLAIAFAVLAASQRMSQRLVPMRPPLLRQSVIPVPAPPW